MELKVVVLLCLLSFILPEVQLSTSNKSRKVNYEYFDDYLLSITAQDVKHKGHNRVPKPDTDRIQPDSTSDPLPNTSDDEDLVQASGDGGVKDGRLTGIRHRNRPARQPVAEDSEEEERPRHHHLYIPDSLPKDERERLEEEEQEEEDEERIRADEERIEEGEETINKDPTRDLDILGYFKDVPREHWSCCMLGKLAGDKGFHCHAGFYAARITTRNPNRAHNKKMLWHGRDSSPTWGWDIMRTFQRCVARHAAEFHKCCFAATIEKRERSKWEHYRRQGHLEVGEEQEEDAIKEEQPPVELREEENTEVRLSPSKLKHRPVATRGQRRTEQTVKDADVQQRRLEEQDRRSKVRRRRPNNRRRQQS